MPSIDSASSQPISGFSGLPKLRQSVKPSGSPPAQATFRAASRIAAAPTGERIERADAAGAVEREREPAERRAQAQHGGIQAGPAHGARLHELVVAPRHERARAERVGADQVEQDVGYGWELGSGISGRGCRGSWSTV